MMKKIILISSVGLLLTSLVFSISSFVMIKNFINSKIDDDITKVVYHVSDKNKVLFTLNNIKNHIKGVEDIHKLRIVLVVNGPALKEFYSDTIKTKTLTLLEELKNDGVMLLSCVNTMDAQDVDIKDIVAGFARIDEGGVVRIAQLQKEGYFYIKP